jgi:hypothetical protein
MFGISVIEENKTHVISSKLFPLIHTIFKISK